MPASFAPAKSLNIDSSRCPGFVCFRARQTRTTPPASGPRTSDSARPACRSRDEANGSSRRARLAPVALHPTMSWRPTARLHPGKLNALQKRDLLGSFGVLRRAPGTGPSGSFGISCLEASDGHRCGSLGPSHLRRARGRLGSFGPFMRLGGIRCAGTARRVRSVRSIAAGRTSAVGFVRRFLMRWGHSMRRACANEGSRFEEFFPGCSEPSVTAC
jgi:hypothetical protein